MSASLHTLQVEILRYNNVISLRNVATNIFILRQTASTIATDLLSRQNTSILANLSVFPGLLEQYNIRYTEKWVKRIDENFLEYYYGLKPALNIPHPSPSQSASFPYIYHKFFSGDVSGMIAESIFIYFLDHLGININLIGHLRPMKQRNAYQPDYVIWDGSNAIKTLIQNPQFQPPLYAEVKGSTLSLIHI